MKDFRLLLSFLNEKNEETLTMVRGQLSEALKARPRFHETIKDIQDPRLKRNVEMFFEEFRYHEIEPSFDQLFEQGENLDLEHAVYLLATMEYPGLDRKKISQPLDKMAQEIDRMMVLENPQPTRSVSAMRHYLFDLQKYRGNEKNYYEPDNILINRVIKRKVGIPISLSCIYLFVAWRLKLLVHGVGLPGHFVVGHREPRGVVYVDPFRRGKILRVKDCEVLVRRLGIPFKHAYLDPSNNLQILARMIVNLINLYNDRGQTVRARWLAKLFQKIS